LFLPALLAGNLIIETLFNYPGLRRRAPVPGDPANDQAIMIGGARALLLNMHREAVTDRDLNVRANRRSARR
jgi:hypothetical protein